MKEIDDQKWNAMKSAMQQKEKEMDGQKETSESMTSRNLDSANIRLREENIFSKMFAGCDWKGVLRSDQRIIRNSCQRRND